VAGQQRPDGLVKALELALAQGDPDQRRDDALAHRIDVVAVAGGQALPVALIDQLAVAHDQQAANLGMQAGHGAGDGGRTDGSIPSALGGAVRQPVVGQ
jgi:hypothetical protein